MLGLLSAPVSLAKQVTSTAANVGTAAVRTGMSVTTQATLGLRRLVRPDRQAQEATAPPVEPEPVVPPAPPSPIPDPDPAPTPEPSPVPAPPRQATTGTPAKKAAAKKAPAKKAPAKKAPAKKATPATTAATAKKPEARPAARKASEVPLKSEPTPASAAPDLPEGPEAPDEALGTEGATGYAEAQPLLDPGTAKQLRKESETLRQAAD